MSWFPVVGLLGFAGGYELNGLNEEGAGYVSCPLLWQSVLGEFIRFIG